MVKRDGIGGGEVRKIGPGTIFKSDITGGGGNEYPSGRWKVVSNTPKNIKLKLIEEDLMGGGYQDLVNEDKIVVIPKGKYGFKEFDGGEFQSYPGQGGTPHYFTPEKPL